jgi:hypothetical protein
VERFFTVQLLLTLYPVEGKRLSACVGTVPGRRIFADECVRSTLCDIDDLALCLRPNHFGECWTEIIEALVHVVSYRTKCGNVEVVEDLDERIGGGF